MLLLLCLSGRALLLSTPVLRRHYACLSASVAQLQGARAHVTCYNRTQVSGVFESTDANQVSTIFIVATQIYNVATELYIVATELYSVATELYCV